MVRLTVRSTDVGGRWTGSLIGVSSLYTLRVEEGSQVREREDLRTAQVDDRGTRSKYLELKKKLVMKCND